MSSNIFYQWQNKKLRDTIDPFREMKLRDFLLIYKEVELWAVMKNQSTSDPAIANRLKDIRQKAQAEHDQVAVELERCHRRAQERRSLVCQGDPR